MTDTITAAGAANPLPPARLFLELAGARGVVPLLYSKTLRSRSRLESSSDGVTFALLVPGASGRLHEAENFSNPARPQRRFSLSLKGGEPFTLEIVSGSGDYPSGCFLCVQLYDSDGKFLEQIRIPLSRRSRVVRQKLSAATANACFSVVLAGTGVVRDLKVRAQSPGAQLNAHSVVPDDSYDRSASGDATGLLDIGQILRGLTQRLLRSHTAIRNEAPSSAPPPSLVAVEKNDGKTLPLQAGGVPDEQDGCVPGEQAGVASGKQMLPPEKKPEAKQAARGTASTYAVRFEPAACLNDYLPQLKKQLLALERVALRERSWRTRELLAAAASGGVLDYAGVVELAKILPEMGLGNAASVAMGLDPDACRALAAIARVAANQNLAPGDNRDAIAIYEALHRVSPATLRDIDLSQYVLLLIASGDLDGANAALESSGLADKTPVEFALLLANLVLARQTLTTGGSSVGHLHPLNVIYARFGYEAVRSTPGPTFFSGLSTAPLDNVVPDGPLVTVLMTTYNPDENVDVAIKAVLNQSWRQLELIIVDDCSSEDSFSRLKLWEQRDVRVRVFRQRQNQGTYAAKNHGLTEARGDFVTCHDSDDWSHPRKIQLQMDSLASSNGIASSSSWVRCTENVEFQLFSGAGKLLYENPSSLLYRRQPVQEKLGFYDRVRTGADSEFKRRMEIVFGKNAISTVGHVPMAFGLTHEAALTANSLGRGWFSHDRRAYRSAWRAWHSQIEAGSDTAFVDLDPPAPRFVVPEEIRPSRVDAAVGPRKTYDVVMISDFRMSGGNTISGIEEIKAQSQAGLRTAICQVGAFRKGFMHKEFLEPKMQAMVSQGQCDWIDLTDEVDTKLLSIRYPGVFQFAQGMTTGIKAESVRVILNQPPAEASSLDRRYDPARCVGNINTIFGPGQLWAPIGPAVREAVVRELPLDLLTPQDWWNIIDVEDWGGARACVIGSQPIIGRHSRDDYSKWPNSPEDLLAAYPASADIEVRVLGGVNSVRPLLGENLPANWTVLEFNSVAPRDFLRTIDFFVFFHHPERIEAFGRTVIEALASGCIAILPRSFEPLFGESAIYCEPAEVEGIVRDLHRDPERYAAMSQRGVDYVLTHFGFQAHLARLTDLGIVASENDARLHHYDSAVLGSTETP